METQTIKIWKKTLKKLRMLYALTGKSMVSIMERIVEADLRNIEKQIHEDGEHGKQMAMPQ